MAFRRRRNRRRCCCSAPACLAWRCGKSGGNAQHRISLLFSSRPVWAAFLRLRNIACCVPGKMDAWVVLMGNVDIGRAGWAYKDWEGIVYPASLKRKQHPVEYLAQYFDLIEINTSFYGHLKPELVKLWCRKAATVNPEFVFTAKLHQ